MTEALKVIQAEELEILKTLATEDEIKKFFNELNYNYGDGEVLNFKQIESFFKNNIHKKIEEDMLNLFIDTIRMLRLVGKSEDEILGLNSDEVIFLHDEISSDYSGEVDEIKKDEYEKSVAPFVSFSGEYGKIRIELIATLEELNKEGLDMNHCIATYHDIIINKQYIGFRVFNLETEERLTLGCYRLNDNKLIFNQLKGFGNSRAGKDSCLSIIDFCNKKSILMSPRESVDLMPAIFN